MLRASLGVPSGLELEDEPPSSLISTAAGDPASARFGMAPVSAGALLWELARECLEDIANLRTHRVPTAAQDWRGARHSEARLLAQVDAVASCGKSTLREVEAWGLDAAVADPDRVFAATFALACINDPECREAAVRILRAAAARDAAGDLLPENGDVSGSSEALCLAPLGDGCELLLPLLHDELPALRAAALRVLAYHRRLAPADLLTGLGDLHRDVLTAAAAAAALLPSPANRPRLEALTRHQHEPTARAALATALACGFDGGLAAAREHCRDGRVEYADAVLWLGVGGRESDARLLNTLIADTTGTTTFQAAALYGDPNLVPILIERLTDESCQPQAASALTAIVGTGPQDTARVSEYEPGDEQYLDRTPEPVVVVTPSQDPVQWRKWWAQRGHTFDPRHRWRDGRPLGPHALVQSLDRGPGDPASRRARYLELRSRAGAAVPARFDPLDFVPVQEEAVAAWRTWLSAQPDDQSSSTWRT